MKLSVAAAVFGVCLVAVGLAPSSPAHAQQSDGLVERDVADALKAERRLHGGKVHPLIVLADQKWRTINPPVRLLTGADPDRAGTVRAGGALAAYALGFIGAGAPVTVFRCNRWTRLSGPGGHVLMR